VRRWADDGRIDICTDASGRTVVDGTALAHLAQELATADHSDDQAAVGHSARNRFTGLISKVVRDTVMAQVENPGRAAPVSCPCSAVKPPTNSASNPA
jgi:hypothetical protein